MGLLIEQQNKFYALLLKRDNVKELYYKAIFNKESCKKKKEIKKVSQEISNFKTEINNLEKEAFDVAVEIMCLFEFKEVNDDNLLKKKIQTKKQELANKYKDNIENFFDYFTSWESENINKLAYSEEFYERLLDGTLLLGNFDSTKTEDDIEEVDKITTEEEPNEETEDKVDSEEQTVEETEVESNEETEEQTIEETEDKVDSEEQTVEETEVESNEETEEQTIEEVEVESNEEAEEQTIEKTEVESNEETEEQIVEETKPQEKHNNGCNITREITSNALEEEKALRAMMLINNNQYDKARIIFDEIIYNYAYNGRMLLIYLRLKLELESIELINAKSDLFDLGIYDSTLLYRALTLLPDSEQKKYNKALLLCLKSFIRNKDNVYIEKCYKLLTSEIVFPINSDKNIEVKQSVIRYSLVEKNDIMYNSIIESLTDNEKQKVMKVYHQLITKYLKDNLVNEANRINNYAKKLDIEYAPLVWDNLLLNGKITNFENIIVKKGKLKAYYKKYEELVENTIDDYEIEVSTLFMAQIIAASIDKCGGYAITILGKLEKNIENNVKLRSEVLYIIAQKYQKLGNKKKAKEFYKETIFLNNDNFEAKLGLISIKYNLLTVDGLSFCYKKLFKDKDFKKIKQENTNNEVFNTYLNQFNNDIKESKRKKHVLRTRRFGKFLIIMLIIAFIALGLLTYFLKAGFDSIMFKGFLAAFVLMFSIGPLFKLNKKHRMIRFLIRLVIFGGIVFAVLYFFKDTIVQFLPVN